MAVCPGAHLGNGEFAIRAVRNDALARLKMEQDTIKVYGDESISPGFKEQENVVALGDPASAEAHAHAPPQWFYI